MSFLSKVGKSLDPTSNSFLGGGVVGKAGRALVDVFTFTIPETFRTDPYGFNKKTGFAKAANIAGGGIQGAFGGFVTGGLPGAVAGGVTGATLVATKTTNPTTIKGGVINVGAGGVVGKIASVGYGAATSGSKAAAATPAFIGPANAPAAAASVAPATSTAASTSVFGSLTKGIESLLPAAFLTTALQKQVSTLLPGTGGGSTGVTLNQPGPGTLTSEPSTGPNLYPGVPSGLQTVSPDSGGAAGGVITAPAAKSNLYIWILAAAVGAYLLMKKKAH